jgi:hypothetical protein
LRSERLNVAQNLPFAGPVGIADAQAHQKTIELRFRQRIRAVVFERVLRGDDHEGPRQRVRVPVDGDLGLIHGFEQGGLRLGRGAIDLVSQQEIGEDRARLELEGFRLDVINGDAENVGREHVAGEL